MTDLPLYLEILNREFSSRRSRNRRYSLRAFARFLQIDPGVLSMILAEKRIPSKQFSQRIPKFLHLSSEEARAFLLSIAETRRQTRFGRFNRQYEGQNPLGKAVPRELKLEEWESIALWYHAAILELTFVDGFVGTPDWISKRLQVDKTDVIQAIAQLQALGLLKEKAGTLIKTDRLVATTKRDETTRAHRSRQKKSLEFSMKSIESVPLERRSHTTMTMSIDPDKLPAAKKMIEEFSRSLCEFLESGKRKRVYELSVSLFPLEYESFSA